MYELTMIIHVSIDTYKVYHITYKISSYVKTCVSLTTMKTYDDDMSNNSTPRKTPHNLVDTSKLASDEEAQEFIRTIKSWVLCRTNVHGDVVTMKNPLVQMANGIRKSITANKGTTLPANFNPLMLTDDEKLVFACMSMLQH